MPTDDATTRVSIGEAARLLGVSVDTMRRWDADGSLRADRTHGGQRRYLLADLRDFLATSTRNAS